MRETTMSDAVLARLEALTARLDEQEVRLDEQAARIVDLEADNAGLAARQAAPAGAAVPGTLRSRRDLLKGVLAAGASVVLVLSFKTAGVAEAGANATLTGTSTGNYGVLAVPGVIAPTAPTFGSGGGAGVIGLSTSFSPAYPAALGGINSGVWGATTAGIGVVGTATSGTGVWGISSNSVGVQGTSTNNVGVFAEGPIGVFATGTGLAGVFGGSNGNGFGFWGNSVANAGVYGTSTAGPGVRAESTNQWGLHAKSPTWAGVFEGNVFVTGQVVALGGVGASATATTRTLAEDVGEATLANGKATVKLDPAFADDIKGGQYQVFVTPHDASGRPLAVVARRRDGFDVQELAGGATDAGTTPGRGSNAGFSYRVVAKLAGPRQAPLAPPDLTTIKPAPPLPEPPKAPEPSGASEELRQR